MILAQAPATRPPVTPVETESRSGEGRIVIERNGDQSRVIRSAATSPLRLLAPRAGQQCAWVFTSTYGGGLLGGDSIRLDVEVGAAARCLLSTQASTKIYRTIGPPSRQELNVRVRSGAVVVSAPDPIVCYNRAWYEQRQHFELEPGAAMLAIDWLTSGRHARGERWAFDRYDSRTQVMLSGRCVVRDSVVLDPSDGPLESPQRMGKVDCYATVLIIGRPLEAHVARLLEWIASQPAPGEAVLLSASPVQGGAIIRIAAATTEGVAHWLRDRLGFITGLVGQSPWARKW